MSHVLVQNIFESILSSKLRARAYRLEAFSVLFFIFFSISGEFQEFNDDVEYILDGLHKRNNLPTRCLSTVTLATKCMEPPFRMHLRAHGTMNKFFAELRDAPQNPGLALCTSTVLFVLSQDRLNMDMDRDSLELMLNLLGMFNFVILVKVL